MVARGRIIAYPLGARLRGDKRRRTQKRHVHYSEGSKQLEQ